MTSISIKDGNGASTTIALTAPGTAGAPSADVLSIQGITGMTPIKIDGSGTTQPVSIPTASTILSQSVVVGTTIGQGTAGALINGVTIKNKAASTATAIVYVGASGVSTSTGFPLLGGQSVFVACSNINQIYFISDTASQAVALLGS